MKNQIATLVATVSLALASAPLISSTASAQAHLALEAVPADATAAFSVDVTRAGELVPYVSIDWTGPDAPINIWINALIGAAFGVTVDVTTLGAFMSFDEDFFAVIGRGSVTGTPTGAFSVTYRGWTIVGDSEPNVDRGMFITANDSGFVVGTLGAITAAIDTLEGVVPSIMATSAAERFGPHIIEDQIAVGIMSGWFLEEFLDDTDLDGELPVDPPTTVVGFVGPAQARAVIELTTPNQAMLAQASMLVAIEAIRNEATSVISDGAGEEFLVDLLSGIGLASLELLASQVTISAVDNMVVVDFNGSYTEVFYESMLAAMTFMMVRGGASDNYQRGSWESGEAIQELRRLYDSSVAYYDSDFATATGDIAPTMFPVSAPLTPGAPCGEFSPDDWTVWDTPTWNALNFTHSDFYYYAYQYDSSGQGMDSTFTASAFGDLDCDGVYSTFVRIGEINVDGEISGGDGVVYIENENE